MLLLLLLLQVVASDSQNNSLRVNTYLKDVNATAMALPSIQSTGNICTREEPYEELLQVPEVQPVRVRTSTWCLEIPPRCPSYKTEMREVMKVQRLNKTRTVRFCCQGYEGNLSDSQASCRPICRGGCGRGNCLMPDICSCEEGYTGKHCTQRCDHDRWGLDCKNPCQCQNDAVCDNKTGGCHCIAGWAGQFCEQPCPVGTHGVMCRKACECPEKRCHPQTGECQGPENLEAVNVNHVVLETINSTMANLTHNINNIARSIGSMSESSHVQVTPSALPEVILIKQPVQESAHTPKIILHESSNALLENLHTAAAAGVPTPEVIHVITSAGGVAGTQDRAPQLNLAGFAAGESNPSRSAHDHDSSLLSTLIVMLLMLMIVIVLGFLYVYRRQHLQKEAVVYNANGTFSNAQPHGHGNPEVVISDTGKIFHGPLPKPPALLPNTNQTQPNEASLPDIYDTPSNNSSITTQPYAYARKESLYSVVSPKSRKGSLDSHLYDEIRYHQQQQQQHHHHQHHHQLHQQHSHPSHQPQSHASQPSRYQHSTTATAFLAPPPPLRPSNGQLHHQQTSSTTNGGSHVSHLIIPPQNANFLQVPSQIGAHKIAHL
ncbi:uncharacterized protein Dmoj_GI12658, isoform A [Drosophila mojavensis]|uniref:Uncharacterized protein, isoform A n=2 Tax=Drosophila mojavensis TaxID=7230 RepID=B4KEM0_DROMO|nr:uncharacterized protein Dmoj_GI12658, isoform A [Drosophila mojavensis]